MRVSRPRPASGTAEVTAVIPCYNYGRYLPAAVASVLDQTDVRARVIVVDDCSTDDSLAVARRLATADPRVTVIAHEVNKGHIATYNDGFDAVTTEYVTLVSADDLVAPGALARATALMDAHPGVGMVYGQPLEFRDVAPASDRDGRAPYTWTRWTGRSWIRLAAFRGRCFILSPEVVMRTAVVREIGGYNAELPKSGDLEYWLRTATSWDVGRVNGRLQAFYRHHEVNMHNTTHPSGADDLRHRRLAFAYLASDQYAGAAADGSTLYRQACRALAREGLRDALRLVRDGRHPDAAEFVAAAQEIEPHVGSGAQARRAIRLIAKGTSAGPRAALVAWLDYQVQRVRWRLWANTGVS